VALAMYFLGQILLKLAGNAFNGKKNGVPLLGFISKMDMTIDFCV
jgi:hypothetical protein